MPGGAASVLQVLEDAQEEKQEKMTRVRSGHLWEIR